MTNTEYEAACITAAKVYDRFEGEHKLKQQDATIAQAEATLARLQADRREIVNRYNLNKCEHNWQTLHSGLSICSVCKEVK